MNISALSFNNFKIQNYKKTDKLNKNIQNNYYTSPSKTIMPNSAQMLAFMGGYSLDLDKTYNSLKAYQYPPRIQNDVLIELSKGNPDDKTLYDVHFDKYKKVLDCYSLDDLKNGFPEFSGVESAYDVEADEESFLGKFQSSDLDSFPSYEDLTLQLIKLYWGQGFSLNDLSEYVAQNSEDNRGINLYYTMKNKLHIPLMNPRYANVLKLSNKEYNEKFTTEMSIKRKEANEEKLQKAQGEAVVIPRGELSPAHKQHISEGLKRHYMQNPEKIYEMSERQKAFYEKHPEKKEEMSKIMSLAWGKTEEGRSILKHLNKFIKKYNGSSLSESELSLEEKMDEKKQSALSVFWQKNGWAREKMSIAVKKAINLQAAEKRDLERLSGFKTIKGERVAFNLGATKFVERIKQWGEKQGIDTKNLILLKGVIYLKDEASKDIDENNRYVARGQKLIERYIQKFPNHADLNTVCLHNVLLNLETMLKQETHRLPESLRRDVGKIEVMKYAFNFVCAENNIPTQETRTAKNVNDEITSLQINNAYSYLINQAAIMGCEDLAEFLDKELDAAYDVLKDLPRFQ